MRWSDEKIEEETLKHVPGGSLKMLRFAQGIRNSTWDEAIELACRAVCAKCRVGEDCLVEHNKYCRKIREAADEKISKEVVGH